MKAEVRSALPPDEEKRTKIALFRYSLIAPLLDRDLERGDIIAHCKAFATCSQQMPYSTREKLHPDTIWRYLASYRKGGFEALKPQERADAGKARRIPEEVIQKAIALREQAPARSATTIIAILRRDPEVPADLHLAPRTLREILHKRGKSRQALSGQSKAFRRFERSEARPEGTRSGRAICSWVPISPITNAPASTGAPPSSVSSTTIPASSPMANSSSRSRCRGWKGC